MKGFLTAVAVGAVSCASAGLNGAALGAPAYTITDIGTLPNGSSSFANDVNNLRQVTGNAGTSGSSNLHAYLWTNGTKTDLGILTAVNFSRGYAINDSGVVVGESDNNTSNAFIYQNGTMSGLTSLQGGNFFGVAHDINNAGVIVGISRANTAAGGTASRATKWVNGVPQDLGSIDGLDNTTARAWAVNNAGTAVGLSRNTVANTSQATLWSGGTIQNLGSLGDNLQFSQAYGINDNGLIVGASYTGQTTGSGTPITHAVIWQGGTITDLGTFGATFSEAKDVNAAGLIVGYSTNISGSPATALLWQNGVAIDLNTLIPAGSGWVLRSAESINDAGDVAGYGTFGGQTHAFLLTVPEPSVAGLAVSACGGIVALSRGRRSRRRQA